MNINLDIPDLPNLVRKQNEVMVTELELLKKHRMADLTSMYSLVPMLTHQCLCFSLQIEVFCLQNAHDVVATHYA